MAKVWIQIDDREIEADTEETILRAAMRNHIFIPHLCHRPDEEEPFGGCRLCFVEVEGKRNPVASCTVPVREGMRIRTDTEPVRRLQRSALRLLLSAHHIDCGSCHANRNCRLQELSRALSVKLKVAGLRDLSRREAPDATLENVVYDANKCVLCGICVRCARETGSHVFHFARRGLETRVALFPPADASASPTPCWRECPVGALYPAGGPPDSQG
jgi:formate dehydrogenase major subunit/NADH-quinone oxidoreductase subunit G